MSYDCDHTNVILSALKGKPWGNNQIEYSICRHLLTSLPPGSVILTHLCIVPNNCILFPSTISISAPPPPNLRFFEKMATFME